MDRQSQATGTRTSAMDVSEAQIAAHWREEEYYRPSAAFIGQANVADPTISDRFAEDRFPDCFREYADLLSWDEYWHTTLDTSNPPFWKWFVGGRLNACYNCVDRHLATNRNKAALIWVPEPETEATRRSPIKSCTSGSTSSRRCCATSPAFGRRPGDDAYADGAGTARHHARLRTPGRHALGGVWRV